MDRVNELSYSIIGASLRIHQKLGPGLYESVYEAILARDLRNAGLKVERQKAFPLSFEGIEFEESFRADLIVEDSVVCEIKSTPSTGPAELKQLNTYLRILDYRLGLLLNFGAELMKDGVTRVANRL